MKLRIKTSLMLIVLLTAFHIGYPQSISKINMQSMKVIFIADTAMATDSISSKMSKDYGILFSQIGQQHLTPGKIMAIYHTANAPWIFDVAVEVDKAPDTLTGGTQFKITPEGEAVVLHYKGPYEEMDSAYFQIDEWIKKNNKSKSGPSIEVYLNDPGTIKDKKDLLTDIYQLIK